MSKSKWKSQAVLLLGTNLGAQILPLLALPFITYLYSPDSFGELSFFVSVTAVLVVLFTMKYDQLVIILDSHKDVNSLLTSYFYIAPFVITLTLLVYFFTNNHEFSFLYLSPITAYIMGGNLFFAQYLNRKYLFFKNGLGKLLNVFVLLLSQFLFALLIGGEGELLILSFALAAASQLVTYLFLVKDFKLRKGGKQILLANKTYPVFLAPATLVNTISINLPALIIAPTMSMVIVGYYFIASKIFLAGASLVGTTLGQAFYKVLTDKIKQDSCCEEFVRNYKWRCFLSGTVVALILLPFLDIIYINIFPNEWHASLTYAYFIIPWAFMIVINTPFMGLFNLYEKQALLFRLEIFTLLLRLGGILYGYHEDDPSVALKAYCIASFISHLFVFHAQYKLLKRR